MRVRQVVSSLAGTAAALIALATAAGGATAAKRVVELEPMTEPETAQVLCPLVRKTLEAFAASPAARKPVCDWRPLEFAESGGLTLPDWKPAGDYVRSEGFARRFLDAWLASPAEKTGKSLDTLWREYGYTRVIDDSRAVLDWHEAMFKVRGDRRAKRWLRLDIGGCQRYPDTSIFHANLPKLAAISRAEIPYVLDGQNLQAEFTSDDVILYEGEAFDFGMGKRPADGSAYFHVRRIRAERTNVGLDEWVLRTSAPVCWFELSNGR
ncbi:hypothetical protein ACFJIW_05200 [Tahibacter sp. UC22_41]|uniref:hypothetical protein n=1 Tax=Tahibacter sp. UC22_41 TaxID=3350178 RepID=UPI0036DE3BED